MTERRRRCPWILPYSVRHKRYRKIRETEDEALEQKRAGEWQKFSRLMVKLRKSWWGYKRIKNK